MLPLLILQTILLLSPILGTPESDRQLDILLAEDGIVLPADVLEFRRGVFEGSWLVADEEEVLTLEAMYTVRELQRKRGTTIVPNETLRGNLAVDHVLQAGEEERLSNILTPRVFDGRRMTMDVGNGKREPVLFDAVNQESCGNCYIHVVVAALEIAYAKATGKKVKLSEQELTDCYFKGCSGGDYRMVTLLMTYIDKLSSREEYGEYMDGEFTCRQATTPDSLDRVKVKDYITVTTDNVEAAIMSFGSVMTCMRWGLNKTNVCRMDNYKAGNIVSYPSYDGIEGGQCDHAVLIVGYTPTFYIVRNSHGKTWGDKGYFYIRRGINSCGIEDTMASIYVESREEAKHNVSNGCPADKPVYCENINGCIAENQFCIIPSHLEKSTSFAAENKNGLDIVEDQTRNDDTEGVEGDLTANKLTKKKKNKKNRKKGDKVLQGCSNSHPKCQLLIEKFGCTTVRTFDIKDACRLSCNECSGEEVIVPIPTKKERTGSCYTPTIPNGRVINAPVVRAGQSLKIRCKAGYTLVGKPVKCLLHNVFTNDNRDGRLLPQCIKFGEDRLESNGAGYTGRKNTWTNKAGRRVTCDNWSKSVFGGVLMGMKDGSKYILGNHNYCRNPNGTEPVPMCLSGTGQGKSRIVFPVYCFPHPGCDTCVGAANNPLYSPGYCEEAATAGKCSFVDRDSVRATMFYWEVCKAACCNAYCS